MRINPNETFDPGQDGFENSLSPSSTNEEALVRQFCYELSATIGFTVLAKTAREAHQKAESCKAQLGANGLSSLSPEHEVYVVLGDYLDLFDEQRIDDVRRFEDFP